jgi:phosphohistidine phosphatase
MAERKIYLVRHGVAEDISATGADFDRALTASGVRKMEAAAAGLETIGVQPGILVASPYRRAQETAGVLAEVLAPAQRETWDELGCGVDTHAVLEKIAALDPREDLMLVGHEPDMGILLSLFLTGHPDGFWTHFRKGAVACISGANLPPQGRARLEWFERATVLGQAGG